MDSQVYRLAPEYRRSAVYAMVGFVFLGVVGAGLGISVLDRKPSETALVGIVYGTVAAAMILPLRWRLRLDDAGIARRWLWRWDRWSWDDFASGEIEKKPPFTFVDRRRPWWRRRLALAYLAKADRKHVIETINRHYRMPAPAPMGDRLVLRYGFRKIAELDWRGVRLTTRGESCEFAWTDVQRVHITRFDPLRRDFTRLALTLPGHEIELATYHDGTSSSWRGSGAAEANEFLLAHVPADRIDINVEGERPRKIEDVRKMLARERERERSFRICFSVLGGCLVAATVWLVTETGVLGAALLFGMQLGLLGPIVWFAWRQLSLRVAEIERWLLDTQSPTEYSR